MESCWSCLYMCLISEGTELSYAIHIYILDFTKSCKFHTWVNKGHTGICGWKFTTCWNWSAFHNPFLLVDVIRMTVCPLTKGWKQTRVTRTAGLKSLSVWNPERPFEDTATEQQRQNETLY